MKIKTAVTTAVQTTAFSNGRDNKAFMQSFWNDPKNAQLFNVGRLLKTVEAGKSYAEHLAAGAEIELESITVDGIVLPLQEGYILSLKNLKPWGCRACGSAHGSNVAPSKGINVLLLESNRFYYNPATRELFTISATCFSDYVKGLGAASRIVAAVAPKPETKAPATAQQAHEQRVEALFPGSKPQEKFAEPKGAKK